MRIGKQDSYVESFGVFKAKMYSRFLANLSRSDVLNQLGAMSQSKANAFDGCVLDSNGNIVFVPYSYGSVVHYDVSSGVYTETALTTTTTARFSGGCLANNGKIILSPLLHRFVGIYDPNAKTYTDGPPIPAGPSYRGAINISETEIIFIPGNAATTKILKYNPITNTASDGPLVVSGAAYEGGCLLPDGRVWLSPTTGNPAIYNPSAGTVTEVVAPAALGNNAYCTSVCLPNGWVVMCPRSATIGYIWDSKTEAWMSHTITFPAGANKWRGACIAQNGDVILIPYEYDYVGRININTLSYIQSSALPDASKTYQFGVSVPDGRMVFAPYNATAQTPQPIIFTPCTQGAGFGSFITQSRFMNHK